jgi:hypothetical protein
MTTIAWAVCGIFETFEAPKRYYKQTGAGFVVPAPALSTASCKQPVMSETHSTLARNILLACLAACLLAVYGRAFAYGPLHMGTDPIMYFVQAANIVHGRPLYVTQQPPGYPFLLATLRWAGCDSIHGVLALNLAALAIACAGSWQLLRSVFFLSSVESACVLLLTLAATTCVDFTTAAMSELPFFAMSTLSLVYLEKFHREGRWSAFIGGLIYGALAILLRTAGWALAAAVLVALYQRFKPGRRILVAGSLLAVVPLTFVMLRARYVRDVAYGQYYSFGSLQGVVEIMIPHKLRAIGEQAVNYSAVNVPLIYRDEFTLLGSLVCVLSLVGAWSLRKRISPLMAYLVAYSTMVWAFPFWENRFWLPVMPCLIAILYVGLREIGARVPKAVKYGRPLLLCYVIAFVLLGCRYSVEYASFSDKRADIAIASLRGGQ